MGPQTNVEQISFTYNGLAATVVNDLVQDKDGHRPGHDVRQHAETAAGIDARAGDAVSERPHHAVGARLGRPRCNGGEGARAQGITDKSVDNVATAQGELDGLQYGGVLKPRGIVGVRGAGFTHDGRYYVKSVSHSISKGQYKQRFSLTREGTGPLFPTVVP